MKKHSDSLEENPFKYSIATKIRDAHVLQMIDPGENDRILDIGSGLGYFSHLMSRRGAIVRGMDIDTRCIVFANRNFGSGFIVGSAEYLPFKASTFDKILCSEVLEHVEYDEQAIAEMTRLGRSGGTVVITVPALEGIFGSRIGRIAHQSGKNTGGEYHHRDGYRAHTLIALMTDHGIDVVDVKYTKVFFVELLMGLTKLAYLLRGKNLESQADVLNVRSSMMFRFYKMLFPLMLVTHYIDQLLPKRLKGHMLIVKGILPGYYDQEHVRGKSDENSPS